MSKCFKVLRLLSCALFFPLLMLASAATAQTWPSAPTNDIPNLLATTYPNYARAGEQAPIASNFSIEEDLRPWVGAEAVNVSDRPLVVGDDGAMRSHCEPSHLNYDDMILFPGQVGKAHLHMYFGNTGADANSTYETLRRTGDSTCGGKRLNRSAYWMPALKDCVNTPLGTGPLACMARRPDYIIIYYKNFDPTKSVHVPRGMQMISGFNMNKPVAADPGADWSPPGNGKQNWKCVDTGANAPYLSADGGLTAAFECPASSQIAITVSTPTCWLGSAIKSADGRSHVTHTAHHNWSGTGVCPVRSYQIWHFDFTVFFSHSGPDDYKTWRASSDDHVLPNGTPVAYKNGESIHIDWADGWDDAVRIAFERDAVGTNFTYPNGTGTKRSFNTSEFGNIFGDGKLRAGEVDHLDLTISPENGRYMAIPPDPTPGVQDGKIHLHTHGRGGGGMAAVDGELIGDASLATFKLAP
jgi:hypothetical protein